MESEQAILETADIIKQSRKYNCNEDGASGLNNARDYAGDVDWYFIFKKEFFCSFILFVVAMIFNC